MGNNYQGNELDLFAKAINWKSYFSSFIKPYLNDKVLEVGAGQGGTTEIFANEIKNRKWTCVEPDTILCEKILYLIADEQLPNNVKVLNGTIDKINNDNFDTILYIDVIEHLERPELEIKKAADLLTSDGYLVILVPAHNYLYSSFDKSIGHKTRYNKKLLKTIIPNSLSKSDVRYLDSVGFLASFMNRMILKQSMPTTKQILFWDGVLVQLSKTIDKLLFYKCGKSLLGVWKKK
jgi:cyclopropane fatty-acyl-phospholipid synthase-like methyltransferase